MRWMKVAGGMVLFFSVTAMAQAPTFQPIGTIHQIMLGIVAPTSDVIFKVPSVAPKTDAEWVAVQNSALTLAETGNLLLLPGRAKDNGEWAKDALAMVAAGAQAYKAANAKDAQAVSDAGDKIYDTCETCHTKYLPNPPQ
jgi:hypothetical protein